MNAPMIAAPEQPIGPMDPKELEEAAHALLQMLDSPEMSPACEEPALAAVGAIGSCLYVIGGVPLMVDALYRVAERDERPKAWSRRIGILERAWTANVKEFT